MAGLASLIVNAALYDKLNLVFARYIAPVAPVVRAPFVVVDEPSFPGRTMAEFIAHAKAFPQLR